MEPQTEPRTSAGSTMEPPRYKPEQRRYPSASAVEGGAFSLRYKSPILAAVLSVAPGLGQVYVGYYVQGFVHILIVLTLVVMSVVEVIGEASPAIGFFIAFFWLYNIIDAGRRAAFYNQAVQGEEDFALPGALPTANGGGSTLLGIALFLTGGVLLTNTAFGISLRWVEAWWPIAPMAIGGYLIVRRFLDRKSSG